MSKERELIAFIKGIVHCERERESDCIKLSGCQNNDWELIYSLRLIDDAIKEYDTSKGVDIESNKVKWSPPIKPSEDINPKVH